MKSRSRFIRSLLIAGLIVSAGAGVVFAGMSPEQRAAILAPTTDLHPLTYSDSEVFVG